MRLRVWQLGLCFGATVLLTSGEALGTGLLFPAFPTFTPFFFGFPSYLSLSQAIIDLNLAIALARENPLDDWRRTEVRKAKMKVDRYEAEFNAEAARENLTPEQINEAKGQLAQEVALGELVLPADLTSPETETSAAPFEETTARPVPSEGGRTVMEDGDKSPADAPLNFPADGIPQAAKAGREEGAAPARTEPSGSNANGTAIAGPATGKITFENLSALNTLTPPKAYDFPARHATRFPASRKREGTPGLTDKSLFPQRAQLGNATGSARLGAVKRAVAKLKANQPIASLAPKGSGAPLSVTSFLPGGPVIQGDFGDGVVAVQLEAEEDGYQVVPLSRAQLWLLYVKLAFYWALVLIPILYYSYRWGARRAHVAEPVLT